MCDDPCSGIEWVTLITVRYNHRSAEEPMTEPTQATTDDEPTTKPQEGDRVLVRSQNLHALGKTGEIKEIHEKAPCPTYVVDLDGGGEGHFSSDVLLTTDDLDMLDRMKNVESVDEVIETIEQIRDMLDGGDA